MVRIGKPLFNTTTSASFSGSGTELTRLVEGINSYEVLVGIPSENAQRKHRKNGTITNNAELALILSEGVPNKHIRNTTTIIENTGVDFKKARDLAMKLYSQSQGEPGWQIPPRPLIEPQIDKYSDEISKPLREAIIEFIQGDEEAAVEKLDEAGQLATAYAQRFDEYDWPPNAPSTIRKKGSSQPNIDYGELRAAITYIVEKDGEEV